MARHLFRFRCPCCDKHLELDTRSGKARPLKPEDTRPAADIDKLVSRQKHEGERLTDVFQRAAEDQAKHKRKLEDAFTEAFEDAKDDKDKPPNPFDLD
jgi:hypothetical protein